MRIKIQYLMVLVLLLLSGCSFNSGSKPIVNVLETDKQTGVNSPSPDNLDNTKQDISENTKTSNTLDLSRKGLAKIDMSVFEKTDLEELNVSFNNLTGALPSQIGKLKNLKILNASDNNMTGVPAEVGQLSKLEILDLSNNQLTGLPNELANLKNLKTLDLSGNQYSVQDLAIIQKSLPEVNYILN